MKKIAKKLALRKEVVRSLAGVELAGAQGGKPPQTRSGCVTDCGSGNTGGTGGPATGGNICLQTEFTCFAC